MSKVQGHTARVAGHALLHEGRRPLYLPRDATYPAYCSCGKPSPSLASAAQAKRWHREHKADVLPAAAGSAP